MSQAKQQTGDIDMPTLLKKVKVAKLKQSKNKLLPISFYFY